MKNDTTSTKESNAVHEKSSGGWMGRLVSREIELRSELVSILRPTRGDIYANKFGTSFMLINGKKVLRMTTDGIPDVHHCLKTWRDVTEDPYMSKVATVDTVLSSLGLLDNAKHELPPSEAN